MRFKKFWKRFWTLDRHHAEGFTLVELIVVIAILAILAGVGTAGYSGYITNANKGADKTLVGNIMRAIETGTNSYAFVSDDSFKMGQLSYPVGFVALSTTNGAQVITSTTEVYPATEGTCEWVTIDNVCTITSTSQYVCLQHTWETKYSCQVNQFVYCTTHSKTQPQTESLSGQYVSDWSHEGGTGQCVEVAGYGGCKKWELQYTSYPTGAVKLLNENDLYVPSTNAPSMCEAAYANQYDVYSDPDVGPAGAGDPLYDSIAAAFGNDLSVLKLSYDAWTSEEGLGYASFYTGATELMDSLDNMAGTLALISWSSTGADLAGLSRTYSNADEILTGVSNNLVTAYGSVSAMLKAWNNDEAMTWDSYGFNVTGRENYSAMRASYNNAFASYMDANGFSAYSDAVRNYSSTSMNILGTKISLPALICTDAFTDTDSGLQKQLGCSDDEFAQLAKLYQEYIDSDACEENGSLVYDVLCTVDSTADVANAYAEMNGGSVYDYYNSYVNEMSELYSAAQTAAGDGIVIVVTVEDGILNFQVSPSAANPRND